MRLIALAGRRRIRGKKARTERQMRLGRIAKMARDSNLDAPKRKDLIRALFGSGKKAC